MEDPLRKPFHASQWLENMKLVQNYQIVLLQTFHAGSEVLKLFF